MGLPFDPLLPWVAIGCAIVPVVFSWRRSGWLAGLRALAWTVAFAMVVGAAPAAWAARWVDFAFYKHDLDAMVRQQHRSSQHGHAAVSLVGLLVMDRAPTRCYPVGHAVVPLA